jgi:hypothetical protein
MASRMTPRDVESRRQEGCERWGQDRAAGRKNLAGVGKTEGRGAMKTPENERTNPSGGKWARCVTHYSRSGWDGN